MMKQVQMISGRLFAVLLSVWAVLTILGQAGSVTVYASNGGSCNVYGYITADEVDGYTEEYVVNGGARGTVYRTYKGEWIHATQVHYSYGLTWYLCYGLDNGSYYGWIDSSFISFQAREAQQPVVQSANTYAVGNRKGAINSHGGRIQGYTSSYVVNGGSKSVQHEVSNGWHITAKNECYSMNVHWYECWDSDDGDYYGWIDADYIDFYDVTPAPAPVQTVIVTQLVTQPPVQTVVVTVMQTPPPQPETEVVTELVTELITEPAEAEESATITTIQMEVAANADDDDDKDDKDSNEQDGDEDDEEDGIFGKNTMLVFVGLGALVLIGAAAAAITLLMKKFRTPQQPMGSGYINSDPNMYSYPTSPQQPVQPVVPQQQWNNGTTDNYDTIAANSSTNQPQFGTAGICSNCGKPKDSSAAFCSGCGVRF